MSRASHLRNWAWLLMIPVAIAIGLVAPGTARERFLHALLTLALFVAAGGTMMLIDAIRSRRPRREIGLAVAFVVLGLSGAFDVAHELTNDFVPGMWVFPVALVVTGIGTRLAYPKGLVAPGDTRN